jgi:hypothetical protein
MEEDAMLRMSIVTDVAAALVVMLAAIGMPGAAWAQTPVVSFDRLGTKLKVGQTVSVTDTAGAEQKGKILNLSPTSLTLTVDDTRHDFPAASVSTIKKHQRFSLLWGTLIGVGVGAGAGVIVTQPTCPWDVENGVCVAMCAGIGAAAGLGVAALIPRWTRTVYQAPSASAGLRVTVAPFVVPKRQGVVVRVSF